MASNPVKCRAGIFHIIQETARVKVFRLKLEKSLSFIPGQFIMLGIEGINNLNGSPLRRSYSIASKPSEKYIELCIAKMENGIVSPRMHGMKEGDSVNIDGPYGNFRLNENKNDLIFIAGGSGIAPIMAMIRTLFDNKANRKIKLFFGVRNENEIIYKKELEESAAYGNFEIIFGYSDDGEEGFIHNVIKKHDIDKNRDCYVCGPPLMVKGVKEVLANKGFAKERIKVDQW